MSKVIHLDKEEVEANVILETLEVGAVIRKISMTDDGISFNNISLSHYHSQDCCEHVYADWLMIQDYLSQIEGKEISKLIIKAVDEIGLLLCFDDVKVLIPCYDEQNGYYSSNLELSICTDGYTKKIDVSAYVEERHN